MQKQYISWVGLTVLKDTDNRNTKMCDCHQTIKHYRRIGPKVTSDLPMPLGVVYLVVVITGLKPT
jgi:hypothetical protein